MSFPFFELIATQFLKFGHSIISCIGKDFDVKCPLDLASHQSNKEVVWFFKDVLRPYGVNLSYVAHAFQHLTWQRNHDFSHRDFVLLLRVFVIIEKSWNWSKASAGLLLFVKVFFPTQKSGFFTMIICLVDDANDFVSPLSGFWLWNSYDRICKYLPHFPSEPFKIAYGFP